MSRYLFEDFTLDMERRELRRGRDLIHIAPQALDVLAFLIHHRERVVSKDDLIAAVWEGRVVSDSALTSRVNAVRAAVGDSGENQRLIKTLPRRGFRFVGQVTDEDTPAAPPTLSELAAVPPLALPDRPSIAVLPFTNMSGDPEQAYFAEGIAEEIITALSRCGGLFVIARNSSFSYRGRTADVQQVGRELGVRYVLEGSVRRAGARLRFTGQLADAASGAQIWAERFDGDAAEVFAMQDLITERVVAAIEPRLQLAEIERLKHKTSPNLNAYDLLLQAQALEFEYTEEGMASALTCLECAIAIDPSYAPALAFAAYCFAERRQQGWARNVVAETAQGLRLANRALEVNKDDANVLWMAAFAVRVLGADPKRSKELVMRSLQLNPNSAMALMQAGWAEAFLGNGIGALEHLAMAERLSPRDPRAWYMAAVAALANFVLGDFEQAAACASKALAYSPRFAPSLRVLAASQANLGRMNEAQATTQRLLLLDPRLTSTVLRTRLQHLSEVARMSLIAGLRKAGLPE